MILLLSKNKLPHQLSHPISLLRFSTTSNLPSSFKPASLRHFLKHEAGLTDTNISSAISLDPRILCSDISTVISPNLTSLRKITSWSGPQIQQVIVANPAILFAPNSIPRLEFWKKFVDGDTRKLFLLAKRNLGLFSHDTSAGIAKKIALLHRYGFARTDIGYIIVHCPRFITRAAETMEVLLNKVEQLGLPRGSYRFIHCLLALSSGGIRILETKMEDYGRLYGWSEEEFVAAFLKTPAFVNLSGENVRRKMEFLVEEVGLDQRYIASHPVLLKMSLDRTLRPRMEVVNALKSEGLLVGIGVFSVMIISEKRFVERFIDGNKERLPELRDVYNAARAGHVQ